MNTMRMVTAAFVSIPFLIAGCQKHSQQSVQNTATVMQFSASQPVKPIPVVVTDPTVASSSTTAPVAELPGRRVLIGKSGGLFVADPTGTSQRKITDRAEAAALSGDGNLVAYADNKGVYVFRLLDGQSVTIANLTEGNVNNLAWSPDQKSVAYDVDVRMKSWNVFLASYPPIGEPRDLGHWYETLSFSPDGKFIVHPELDTTNGAKGSLEAISVDTGKRETIYQGTDVIWDAQYAPNGSSIAFLMTRPDPNAGSSSDSDDDVDCRGPDLDLWVLRVGSKTAQKVMANVFHFAWSPDGRLLAVETGTEDCGYPPGDGAIFISSSDGKTQFQLSKNAPSFGARFSPDSKQVIFMDFNTPGLVVGDLPTRNLTSLIDRSCVGGECAVYDWK